MKKKIGKITIVTMLFAVIILLGFNLVAPFVQAIPVGQAVEFLGAFTGPRTGYDREDNTKASLDMLHAITWGYNYHSVEGSSMPRKVWYVDANMGASGDGRTPTTAFVTIQEAITASTDSTDDWIFVFDYSGGGATITMDKAFVHLIGNAGVSKPYPRLRPASAVAAITYTSAGDYTEIAYFTIGGGDQTVEAISFPAGTSAGAWGAHIHHNVIGVDSSASGNDGILVAASGSAPWLRVENNWFYGNGGSGLDQSGIQIAGNSTRGAIVNNFFSDLGTSTHPAINLSGSVTQMRIEDNRIAGKDDTTQGWGITISAGCAGCWVDGNSAGSSNVAADAEAYEDDTADEANFWGFNTTDISTEMPGDD